METKNNTGQDNSGYRNSGDMNSGYRNSGDRNSGDMNSGYRNSGDMNSGDRNSGYRNSGDRNSGYMNSGNMNSGCFCTGKNPKIKIFDVESEWTIKEWIDSKANQLLMRFVLTEWIEFKNMNDGEKKVNPNAIITDGYLKTFEYKEAFGIMWNKFTAEEKAVITSLPNFNSEKFKEITGIDIELKAETLSGKKVSVIIGDKTYTATID